jgi:hypothetical protein
MTHTVVHEVIEFARDQVLARGTGLSEHQISAVLRLPDDAVPELLELAHQVRLRWCGPEVEVEGIVSVKTGGCPEDCHFCSQSGQFTSPVRSAWLDIPGLVNAAKQTAATGATEFCIVAAVRGPDARLMRQLRAGVTAIRAGLVVEGDRSQRVGLQPGVQTTQRGLPRRPQPWNGEHGRVGVLGEGEVLQQRGLGG